MTPAMILGGLDSTISSRLMGLLHVCHPSVPPLNQTNNTDRITSEMPRRRLLRHPKTAMMAMVAATTT